MCHVVRDNCAISIAVVFVFNTCSISAYCPGPIECFWMQLYSLKLNTLAQIITSKPGVSQFSLLVSAKGNVGANSLGNLSHGLCELGDQLPGSIEAEGAVYRMRRFRVEVFDEAQCFHPGMLPAAAEILFVIQENTVFESSEVAEAFRIEAIGGMCSK